jgi:hypothetical protein
VNSYLPCKPFREICFMKLNRIPDTTLCLILAVSFLCVSPSRISANPDVRAVKIAEAKGRLFVLAIGIDHYVSAKLARLQLAGKDAREIVRRSVTMR